MNNDSKIIELQKQHTSILEKTTFMLVTASTASIGFILTQLKQTVWNDLIWLPIIALLLLGLSFYFGCSQLRYKAISLKLNADYLTKYSNIITLERKVNIASKKLENADKIQKICLFLGAIIYTLYVIIDIYIKSI